MNPPILFLIGATHRTAPLELRERLALKEEAESDLAHELAGWPALREFAILSTCNRIEIYGVGAREDIPGKVALAFCARQGVSLGQFQQGGFFLQGREVVQHLLEVTSGLDSQMLGETEITGQVKRAYAAAQGRTSAGPVLNRLFQKAFQAAKLVRTGTAVTSGHVSTANAAVDVALNVFGDLQRASVLVLGAGEMGEKCARAFASRGAGRLTVSSRTAARAVELASRVGAGVVGFEDRALHLGSHDIVLCATSSPCAVVSAEAVRQALPARAGRPLLLVDLAMPRDVEPEAAALSHVFVYNLQDLARITEKSRAARAGEAERARALLAPRANALWAQLQRPISPGQADASPRPAANSFSTAAFA